MKTLFQGGRVFDGTGSALQESDVLVEDGRIVSVGPALGEEARADVVVDCAGHSVLPGLFDCHIHLGFRHEDLDETALMHEPFTLPFFRSIANLTTTLGLGITTVRDASGADAGLRRAVEEGTLLGPRMQISVNMLSMTGGHSDGWLPSGAVSAFGSEFHGMPSGVCDGVDGVVLAVRTMVRAGADVIKIASSGGFLSTSDDPKAATFSQDEVDAIVRTASDLGVPVMAHAHGAEGIKRAVRAGVRSIEHGTYLDREGVDLMVEHGTWLVPTLTAGATCDTLAEDPRLPEAIRDKLRGLGHPERETFRMAVDSGVKVAMGTDCPVSPHGTNLDELRHMAAHGFSPLQALHAATLSAAELMGLDGELGTLSDGKRADVVLVEGDALDFTDLESRVRQVWKDGVRVVG